MQMLEATLGVPALKGDPNQIPKFLAKIYPFLLLCSNHRVIFTKDSLSLVVHGENHVLEEIRNLLVREPSHSIETTLGDIPPSNSLKPEYQLEDLHLKPATLKAIVAAGIRSVTELTQFSPLELRHKFNLSPRQIEDIQFCLDGVQLLLKEEPKPDAAAA
jgi:hypothetical protein